MSSYKQLILVDCDGGRGSLFNDTTIFCQLPPNCEFYLFWNKHDPTVTDGLYKQLSGIPQIHLCPSHFINSKNSADGKLIYFLGKLVEKFQFILLVHGNDNIYKEVIKSVIDDYSQEKIAGEEIQFPSTQVLNELFSQCRKRNEQHRCVDPKLVDPLLKLASVRQPIDTIEASCSQCSKTFKDKLVLWQHKKQKHKINTSLTCACSFTCVTTKKFKRHQKAKKQPFIDDQGIVCCLAANKLSKIYLTTDSASKTISAGKTNQCHFPNCARRYFKPSGFISHLKAKHANDIDIQVQCCNLDIKYTLDEFHCHVNLQHKLVGA
ncbi:unnamed protein product [Adineta steineri]|uniref:C2H2-type domain-containing protein n=1 Tax=Adineta steineri TaxID=433720 RepID=A0A815BSH1_9BILA|nr:unnamed protein product [Adineta steineri]CAF1273813.1 unnamed protein product [Adineta steineri]